MEPGKAKKKKKAGKGKTKNALSQSSETAIAKIVTSVEENGWAVADNFATAEMVENARREIKVLKQAGSMKQSEIWVGQEAGVGAHVKVPEVRGDHVMWMCGGHKRHNSSSFSMNLETERDGAKVQATKSRWTKEEAGPIEPCAIRVAESVKIKQFAGLTLLLDAIDKLVVGKLSKRCARLHHVTDRTDAMVRMLVLVVGLAAAAAPVVVVVVVVLLLLLTLCLRLPTIRRRAVVSRSTWTTQQEMGGG